MSKPNPSVHRVMVRLASGIVLLLAAGFAYGGWRVVDGDRHMIAVGEPAEATILDAVETRTRARDGTYYPPRYQARLRFATREGTEIVATAEDFWGRDEIRPGRVVAVFYDPAEPSQVRLAVALEEGPGSRPWMLFGTAAVLALGAGLVLARMRRA